MRYLTMGCLSTMHTCFTSASTTRATATGLNLSKDSRYSQTASKNTSYLTNSSKLPPLVLICTVTGPMKKLMNSSILAVWSAKIQTRFRCSKTWMSNRSYNWMPMNWIKSQIILLKRCNGDHQWRRAFNHFCPLLYARRIPYNSCKSAPLEFLLSDYGIILAL